MAKIETAYLFRHSVEDVFEKFMEIIEREVGKKVFKGLKFKKKRTTTKGSVTMNFEVNEFEKNKIYGTKMVSGDATYITKYTFVLEDEGCGVEYFEEVTRNGRIKSASDRLVVFFLGKRKKRKIQTLFMYINRLLDENISIDYMSEEMKTEKSEKLKEKMNLEIEYEVENEQE